MQLPVDSRPECGFWKFSKSFYAAVGLLFPVRLFVDWWNRDSLDIIKLWKWLPLQFLRTVCNPLLYGWADAQWDSYFYLRRREVAGKKHSRGKKARAIRNHVWSLSGLWHVWFHNQVSRPTCLILCFRRKPYFKKKGNDYCSVLFVLRGCHLVKQSRWARCQYKIHSN